MISRNSNSPIKLFCFCGPSGSGKTSICQGLLTKESDLKLSISTTTRSPRETEQDGVHYRFVSREQFESLVKDGKFLEHAEYRGNLYGTELRNIDEAQSSGVDLLFDIDVQGAQQLRQRYSEQLVVVMVMPPSPEELRRRIEARGQNSAEDIARRMKRAGEEIHELSSPGLSDYLLVNDQLEEAVEGASAIIRAERMHIERFQLDDFTKKL